MTHVLEDNTHFYSLHQDIQRFAKISIVCINAVVCINATIANEKQF